MDSPVPRRRSSVEGFLYCESGLHLQGLLKAPATYEPFSPESVGAKRKLHYGSRIGRKELLDFSGGMKFNIWEPDIAAAERKVRPELPSVLSQERKCRQLSIPGDSPFYRSNL